jgi:hypothetical protein
MKKAFFINGGAGRVLCAIPALESYKQNVDPDVVIVAEAWDELFMASPVLRDNIYPITQKDLFVDKLKDREIISPEPYRLNSYFNQKCNLIQAFDILINQNTIDIPETKGFNLEISKHDQVNGYNLVESIKQSTNKEKCIVFQPFGSGATKEGDFIIDSSGRSFELCDIYDILEELSKYYAVIIMSTIGIPPKNNNVMNVAIPENVSLLQWMGIIKASDYFLGCDSMGQHYANALDKPATIVIGSTFPENISYPNNKNFTIIDNGKEKRRYIPMRLTPDYQGERNNEDLMILEKETKNAIIKSITNKLGKPSKDKIKQAHVHGPNCNHSPANIPFEKKSNLLTGAISK